MRGPPGARPAAPGGVAPPVPGRPYLPVTSKKRLFEQVGQMFETSHGLERDKVFDSLFARERLGSTGLGHGVAIPHGRIKGLKNPLAAVLRLQQPIPFDAPVTSALRPLRSSSKAITILPNHRAEIGWRRIRRKPIGAFADL